eukprot:2943630-Rhodomonas_salina.1
MIIGSQADQNHWIGCGPGPGCPSWHGPASGWHNRDHCSCRPPQLPRAASVVPSQVEAAMKQTSLFINSDLDGRRHSVSVGSSCPGEAEAESSVVYEVDVAGLGEAGVEQDVLRQAGAASCDVKGVKLAKGGCRGSVNDSEGVVRDRQGGKSFDLRVAGKGVWCCSGGAGGVSSD